MYVRLNTNGRMQPKFGIFLKPSPKILDVFDRFSDVKTSVWALTETLPSALLTYSQARPSSRELHNRCTFYSDVINIWRKQKFRTVATKDVRTYRKMAN